MSYRVGPVFNSTTQKWEAVSDLGTFREFDTRYEAQRWLDDQA